MNEHQSFPWDHHSDQPHIMSDKKLKRKIYLKALGQMIKHTLLLPLLPVFIFSAFIRKPWKESRVDTCIGLSVHVETKCSGKKIIALDKLTEMVDDLGCKQILIRIPLSEANNFDTYIQHIDSLSKSDREISVNLIQDRINLDDKELLNRNLRNLLPRLKGKITHIHVGNAFNRRKWAFTHFGEYHNYFQNIRIISSELAPEIKLVGGAVIDFEIPAFLESLFHFRRGHYDGYGAQLYVDRRGAPENTQAGFNFLSKIRLIDTMRLLSMKAKGSFWISEFNWPLKDTGKFAPCSGKVLVDEKQQANYLTRAYLLAMASGKIRTCYWHQLVAPGYGLVDNRGDNAKKRPSYHAFKALTSLFNKAKIIHFDNGNFNNKKGLYRVVALTDRSGTPSKIHALWCNDCEHQIKPISNTAQWLDQNGNELDFSDIAKTPVTDSVIYAIEQL